MHGLEQILALFIAALVLAGTARHLGAPYPVFLALGGAVLAFVPGAPTFTVPPELVLAIFVAPILLDAAYDASLRDLKDNWAEVTGLVVFAVGLTTLAVAVVVRTLMPEIPWGPAIALGAVVAPPDAVAATSVLRLLKPPHRILTILEGESLLNDATALLIYRLAVGAVAANEFSVADVAPAFLLGSCRQHCRRPGTGVVDVAIVRSCRARADGDHPPVRHHVRRLDTRRGGRAFGGPDDGVLRDHGGAILPGAHAGACPHPDLRGVGDGGVRADHPGVHLHRPADSPDPRQPGSGRPRTLLLGCRRRARHRDRRTPRLAHVLERVRAVAAPARGLQSAAADVAADRSAAAWSFPGRACAASCHWPRRWRSPRGSRTAI